MISGSARRAPGRTGSSAAPPARRRVDGEHQRDRPGEELERRGRPDGEAGAADPAGGGQRQGEQAQREHRQVVAAGGQGQRADRQDGDHLQRPDQRGRAGTRPAAAPRARPRPRPAVTRANQTRASDHQAAPASSARGAGRTPPCPAGTADSRAAAHRRASAAMARPVQVRRAGLEQPPAAVLDDERPPPGPGRSARRPAAAACSSSGTSAVATQVSPASAARPGAPASGQRARSRLPAAGRHQLRQHREHGRRRRTRSTATAPQARCGASVDPAAVEPGEGGARARRARAGRARSPPAARRRPARRDARAEPAPHGASLPNRPRCRS